MGDFGFDADFLLLEFRPKNFLGVENWNVANRLKRVFPKFRADRNHVRGVNGRLNFRKIVENAEQKTRNFLKSLSLAYPSPSSEDGAAPYPTEKPYPSLKTSLLYGHAS